MTLVRRIAALEARLPLPRRQPKAFVVMPWDFEPSASSDDLVMSVTFVRPSDQPGGETVPYQRTGLHPRDDPGSFNDHMHRSAKLAASRVRIA